MVRSRWFVQFVVVLLVLTGAGGMFLTAGGRTAGGPHRWEPDRGTSALIADRQGGVQSDGAVAQPLTELAACRDRGLVPRRFPRWLALAVPGDRVPTRSRPELYERWARAPPLG